MTTTEMQSRDARTIRKIETVLRVHDTLKRYAAAISVTVEDAAIILRGQLPSASLKQELVPAIRQAGVLYRVSNQVSVVDQQRTNRTPLIRHAV